MVSRRISRSYNAHWLVPIVACVALLAGCERPAPREETPTQQSRENPAPRTGTSEEIALADPPVILVLGDSLSAGYGVEEAAAWPALLQAKLQEEAYPHRVINAGISGDTSAGGLARMDWLLRQPVAILIVELGGNDGLRGQSPENTRRNLVKIIDKGQAAGARVVLAGMKMPANLGRDYLQRFNANYPELAEQYDLPLIPFILAGVAGRRDLTLPDGIHPNAAGYRIVLRNVWEVLEPLLERN